MTTAAAETTGHDAERARDAAIRAERGRRPERRAAARRRPLDPLGHRARPRRRPQPSPADAHSLRQTRRHTGAKRLARAAHGREIQRRRREIQRRRREIQRRRRETHRDRERNRRPPSRGRRSRREQRSAATAAAVGSRPRPAGATCLGAQPQARRGNRRTATNWSSHRTRQSGRSPPRRRASSNTSGS